MKKILKNILLIMSLTITSIFAGQSNLILANSSYNYLVYESNERLYGSYDYADSQSYYFYSDTSQYGYFMLVSSELPDIHVEWENLDYGDTHEKQITIGDWEYDTSSEVFYVTARILLFQGNYVLSLRSNETFPYGITIFTDSNDNKNTNPSLNNKKLIITAGQKKTLKVYNHSGNIKWASSKNSVATVSNKGVVKAKKAGSAKITAKVDGKTLTCTVTVKKNIYKQSKASLSQVSYGNSYGIIYKAYYKKGKIICNAQLINNCGHNFEKLKNIKITIKSKSGKVIAKQNFGTKNISVSTGSSKTMTFTIDKKHIKNKNGDLRCAAITFEGSGYYHY